MKKLLSLILAILIIFSVTACTSKIVETEPEKEPEITFSEEEIDYILSELPKTIEINAGVFWYNYADAFLETVREAMNSEFDAMGIKYTNYDAENSQLNQIIQIDEAIKSGTNLLIVNIVDTASVDMAQSIVNIAKSAGIPIIFFNREVDDSVINSYENACFVGSRPSEAAEKQGTMAGQFIVENYDEVDLNGDGYISYIMMMGELIGSGFNEIRMEVSLKFCNAELTIANKPELVYYDTKNESKFQKTDWRKDKAFEQMATALSNNPMESDAPIELVISCNDDAAMGCVEALNNIGWNTGEKGAPSIPVFGIDYTAEAAEAIKNGKMTGSILQSVEDIAETIADLVENVRNGENVFYDVVNNFNVDESSNKIRVPYEIIT